MATTTAIQKEEEEKPLKLEDQYTKTGETVSTTVQENKYTPQEVKEGAGKLTDDDWLKKVKEGRTLSQVLNNTYPKPQYDEGSERKGKLQRNAALLADMFRVITDTGTAFAGGNVYQREGAPVYDKIDANLNKLKEDYNKNLHAHMAAQMAAKEKDADAYDRMLAGNERLFDGKTSTTTQTTKVNRDILRAEQEDKAKKRSLEQQRIWASAGAGSDKNKPREVEHNQKKARINPGTYKDVMVGAFNSIIQDPALLAQAKMYLANKKGFGDVRRYEEALQDGEVKLTEEDRDDIVYALWTKNEQAREKVTNNLIDNPFSSDDFKQASGKAGIIPTANQSQQIKTALKASQGKIGSWLD